VLGFFVCRCLLVEADDGQQLLCIGKHLLLNDGPQFFVARPRWVLTGVVSSSTENKVDDLIAKVLRITDVGGLFNFFQLRNKGTSFNAAATVDRDVVNERALLEAGLGQ